MRVLFVQENGMNESLGIHQLSAVLKNAGHQSELILLSHSKDIYGDIEVYKPDLLCFSCMTGSHHSTVVLMKNIKDRFPKIPNILGGPHPTFYPDVLKKDGIDMICVGEGEGALLDLADKLSSDSDITNIANINVKQDGKIIVNPVRPLIQDLDALPMPDREIYYKYTFLSDVSMKRFLTSRGCPYPCSFCYNAQLMKLYKNKGKYIRRKSVDRVIEEVLSVKEHHKLKLIHFSDDNMLLDKEWLREFSEKFPKQVGLPFNCNTRFDQIDSESARYLKAAGCFGVSLGLEAGAERIRNELLKKKIKNETIVRSASILKDNGLRIMTTNIIGSPTETLEEIYMTVELNQQIKADFGRAFVLMAFPDLEITKVAQAEGILPADYSVDDCETGLREVVGNESLRREIKNLIALFYFAIRFPSLWKIIKASIKLPIYPLLKPLELLLIFQEMRFYQVELISGFRFFVNTIEGSKGHIFGKRKVYQATTKLPGLVKGDSKHGEGSFS